MPLIDKSKPEYVDIPDTLQGEVLLERTHNVNGEFSGWLTAPVKVVKAMSTKSDEELKKLGWEKYKPEIIAIAKLLKVKNGKVL